MTQYTNTQAALEGDYLNQFYPIILLFKVYNNDTALYEQNFKEKPKIKKFWETYNRKEIKNSSKYEDRRIQLLDCIVNKINRILTTETKLTNKSATTLQELTLDAAYICDGEQRAQQYENNVFNPKYQLK